VRDSECFAAGTLVLTPAGERPIEAIQAGDLVLSWDFAQAALVPAPVVATMQHGGSAVLALHLANGTILQVTAEHPLWVRGDWLPAGRVRVGDALSHAAGVLTPVRVVTIQQGAVTDVYNIEVGHSDHTYVAGGILVHNKLAAGGIRMPVPGGVWDVMAEAGVPEAAIPLNAYGAAFMRRLLGIMPSSTPYDYPSSRSSLALLRAAEALSLASSSGIAANTSYTYNVNANYGKTQEVGSLVRDLRALEAMTSS